MKQLFAWVLVLSLLTDTGIKLGFLAKYCYQIEVYITQLCEKKDVKDNHCEGLCQLSQEISNATPNDDSSPTMLQIEESQPLLSMFIEDFKSVIHSQPMAFSSYIYRLLAPFTGSVHPPPEALLIA
jgi:hypothetical protein